MFQLGLSLLVAFPCSAQVGPTVADLPAPKSPTVALALSLGGTLLPTALGAGLVTTGDNKDSELALLIAGVYLGPTLGHLYANQTGPALRGLGLRAALLGASLLALTQTGVCLESCEPGEVNDELAVVLVGSVLSAASALLDILAAPKSAQRYNETRATLSLVPWWSPSLSGGRVGVRLTF